MTKWFVETEKCVPYFSSHYACAICLAVCPYNAKAFGGQFKDQFVKTIKMIDVEQMKADLRNDLQEPWSLVPSPAESA